MEATEPKPIGLPPGASLLTAGEDEAKYASRNVVVRKLIARLLRELRVAAGSTGGTWVDVGIGEGLALEAMQVRAGSLVGVEYRSDKLAMALQRLPAASGVRADAGMLPFPIAASTSSHASRFSSTWVHPNEPWKSWHGSAAGAAWCPSRGSPSSASATSAGARTSGVGATILSTSNTSDLRRSGSCSVARFGEVTVHPCFPWIIAVATPR